MAHHSDNPDYLLALVLQAEFDGEFGLSPRNSPRVPNHKRNESPVQIIDDGPSPAKKYQVQSLIDPEWEVNDPTPDIHSLFMKFNKTFFWNKLSTVEVRWSPRMYKCAGVCAYEGRRGLCSIRLSEPLLKLRPRSDLVETLLHEMIHAYLFLTNNDKDRDGHGPEFKKHMYRINAAAGTNISIYHNFHEEVKLYQTHWWRCDGPCRNRPPFFGMVKRSMNRKPGPNDFWWPTHQATCGGTFIKVREPEGFRNKTKSENIRKRIDIRNFFNSPVSGLPKNVVSINDVHKNVGSTNGIIKKNAVNSGSATSGKGVYEKSVSNNVVGFSDLTNQNKSETKRNIFGGDGKKLGSGAVPKGSYGGIAIKNKGTSTVTVRPKSNNKTESKGKTGTKPTETFVPFRGSGHKLGGSSSSGVNRFSGNSKPVSPLVFNMLKRPSTKPLEVSPEKYKNDFLNVSNSDDELAVIDEATGCQENNNCKKTYQYTPEKYKDEFLNISGSDDELAVVQEPNNYGNCSKTNKYSPEKFKDEFLNKTNSDDDLSELDMNDEISKNNDIVPCPVCNLKIHRDDMSIHLQMCDVLNSTIENMNNSSLLETNSDDEEDSRDNVGDKTGEKLSPPNKPLLPCPCCSKYVNETDINKHLDECLSLLAIKEFDKEF